MKKSFFRLLKFLYSELSKELIMSEICKISQFFHLSAAVEKFEGMLLSYRQESLEAMSRGNPSSKDLT